MRKLIACFFAAVAAVASFAATPLAYWDQDFTGADTASGAAPTGGTATEGSMVSFASGNHTLAADAKSITVGESIVGVKAKLGQKLTLGDPDGGMTIMLAYSDFPAVGDTLPTAIGDFINVNSDMQALVTCPEGLVRYDKGTTVANEVCVQPGWSSSLDLRKLSVTAFAPVSGVTNLIAASYDLKTLSGPRFFVNNGSGWQCLAEAKNLKGGGHTTIDGFAIGGFYSEKNRTGNFAPATGMEIHSVAIFRGALSVDELANWDFPSRKVGSKDLSWNQETSGSWTATQFGDLDYEKEDYHNISLVDSDMMSAEPVTVTVEGDRSVPQLLNQSDYRDFTLTGGSVTVAEKLANYGLSTLRFASGAFGGAGELAITKGALEVTDVVFTPENLGALTLTSPGKLVLGGKSHLSTTNTPSLYAAKDNTFGTIEIGDEAVVDVVVGEDKALRHVCGSLAGTGTLNFFANSTDASNADCTYFPQTGSFTGKVNFVMNGKSGKNARIIIQDRYIGLGRPEVTTTTSNASNGLLVDLASSWQVRNFSGNADIQTQYTGPNFRLIDNELTRDCSYSGNFLKSSYCLTNVVRSIASGFTWTYAGKCETTTGFDKTLKVTDRATVALTGQWLSAVVVDETATLEIRRTTGALSTSYPLTVNGTLKLASEDGVAAATGSEIVFGENARLEVTAPEGFFEQKENRKVEFPIVTATTSLTLPEDFKPVIPEGAELVQVTNDGGDLVGLSIRRKKQGLILLIW